MVMMGNLHEAPLLYLLQRRLKEGKIYTWAGDVLISLNPYSDISELYQVATKGGCGREAVEGRLYHGDCDCALITHADSTLVPR